jgi:hypothetical protein
MPLIEWILSKTTDREYTTPKYELNLEPKLLLKKLSKAQIVINNPIKRKNKPLLLLKTPRFLKNHSNNNDSHRP